MNIDEIKELVQLVLDTGIAEIEVKRGEDSVRIRRSLRPSQLDIVLPHGTDHPQATVPAAPGHPGSHVSETTQPAAAAGAQSNDIIVTSPIVGTYYDAPSPGSPPFVGVGDRVEPKQVLCIIESMKLMNEIEAEVAGVVVSKLMENGRPVEYGEALFAIRPR
jgi:acetyl-CoA carboxylase biotin carboxyl carrier protein